MTSKSVEAFPESKFAEELDGNSRLTASLLLFFQSQYYNFSRVTCDASQFAEVSQSHVS